MSVALRDYPLLLLIVWGPLLLAMVELGYRIGRRGRRTEETYHEQFAATRDQAGVLLSLLLGFTLAMSLSRYDLRMQQTADEADAISTAELRAALLPEPMRSQAKPLFREYVDTRIEFGNAGIDPGALDRARARSAKVQAQLWTLAVTAAEQDRTPITGLFVQSVNDTIDADDQRLAGLENRIPRAVWFMLGALSILTSILVGLSLKTRSLSAMLIPPLMFAVVSLLIADLDTPRGGLIHTASNPIQRLQTP